MPISCCRQVAGCSSPRWSLRNITARTLSPADRQNLNRSTANVETQIAQMQSPGGRIGCRSDADGGRTVGDARPFGLLRADDSRNDVGLGKLLCRIVAVHLASTFASASCAPGAFSEPRKLCLSRERISVLCLPQRRL